MEMENKIIEKNSLIYNILFDTILSTKRKENQI